MRIGLVNNMPDAALDSTEQQFSRLLSAVAGTPPIALQRYTLSGVTRGETGKAHLRRNGYRGLAALYADAPDALVITGTEPLHSNLRQEAYWPELAKLFDWLARKNLPALFSCLAAHAAVLHFDGIARKRLPAKTFGLFAHDIARHPLTAGLRGPLHVAHSRWNEVEADTLDKAGYRILTHSPQAGADLFVRRGQDGFVFFQGHPEYDTETLGREYRRDVRRFLTGAADAYPNLPRHYFRPADEEKLQGFRTRALKQRDEAVLQQFPVLHPSAHKPGGTDDIVSAWLRQILASRTASRAAAPMLEEARGA